VTGTSPRLVARKEETKKKEITPKQRGEADSIKRRIGAKKQGGLLVGEKENDAGGK